MSFVRHFYILALCLSLSGIPNAPATAQAAVGVRPVSAKAEAPACRLLELKKMSEPELQEWIRKEHRESEALMTAGQLGRAIPLAAALAPLALIGVVTLPVGIAISAGLAIASLVGGTYMIYKAEAANTQVECAQKLLSQMQVISDASSPATSSLSVKNFASATNSGANSAETPNTAASTL